MEGVAGALSEEGFTGALISQGRGVNRPTDHEKGVAEEAPIALELRVDNVERVAGRSNEREGVVEALIPQEKRVQGRLYRPRAPRPRSGGCRGIHIKRGRLHTGRLHS